MHEKLDNYIKTYISDEVTNDNIHNDFTNKTDTIDYLRNHRNYIERNNLGFGDRAFAYMWFLILNYVKDHNLNGNLLEIGVFKGQIISLWSLISKEIKLDSTIVGITPLEGNPHPKLKLLRSILYRISKKYREDVTNGNNHENLDYLQIIQSLYKYFELPFDNVRVIKGYSTDKEIIKEASQNLYSVIYIDGDHTFDGVTKDINNFNALLQTKGLLIMDDASCNIPGTHFWKGFQSVSDACKMIEPLGFKNILNVGHNRVYQKL